MKGKEFDAILKNMRLGMDLIEENFTGVFTNYEKITIVLKAESTKALLDTANSINSIDCSLCDYKSDGIADIINQLIEAVEKL